MAKGWLLTMESHEWQPVEVADYKAISAFIGGHIESIGVDAPVTVYCHEEGKLIHLLPTALWIDPRDGELVDTLCGPVLLLGEADDDGNDTDLSEANFRAARRHIIPIYQQDRCHVAVPEPQMTIIPLNSEEEFLKYLGYRR